jgi:hypothetical protein
MELMRSTAGRAVALMVVLSMCLFGAQSATAGTQQERAGAAERPVAHTKAGHLGSRIVGETRDGRKVTGAFVPLKFVKRDGKVFVRGLVQGVVHENNGDRTTFAKMKTARVKTIEGTPIRAGRATSARATCDILNLVLGPLDLDLLGLQVHLDRVVLNIVAESGAGKLLGNLLCAVAGLLDGGLGGLLGRLTNLLNQILGVLRLG